MSPHTAPPDPLDTLLHALREAQPSSGLEARVLHRLQDASANATTPQRAQPVSSRPLRLVLLPVTGAIAAALVLVLFLAHRPAPPTPTKTAGSPTPTTLVQPPLINVTPTPVAQQPTHRPRLRSAPSLAQLETAAPSLPPPPLPITPEERNIQRFRSLHSAVALAALSPEAVSLHHATDQSELENFFDPDHKEN